MSLSQDEIDALLGGTSTVDEEYETNDNNIDDDADETNDTSGDVVTASDLISSNSLEELTPDEIDVLGEIGNICMGAVATTMYTLLDRRVSITTPRVSMHTPQEVLKAYEIPFVVVRVGYVEGILGNNLLVLREEDAALITDLLMGGDGTVENPVVLTELHLSAISEIMNQMMGASSTALSKLLHTPVNISPPQSMNVSPDKDVSVMLDNTDVVIKISFDMEIEGLLRSELLQILPHKLGLDLAKKFMESGMGVPPSEVEKIEIPRGAPVGSTTPKISEPPPPQSQPQQYAPPASQPPVPQGQQHAPPPGQQFAPPGQQYGQPAAYAPQTMYPPQYNAPPMYDQQYPNPYQQPQPATGGFVDVHPMSYQAFDSSPALGIQQKSIDMIYDIPLQVTVELGKTRKEISEILEFGTGTIVVLDKIAGDPVEIIVNGKLIARGEVVVIEDNYGVRITEILNN